MATTRSSTFNAISPLDTGENSKTARYVIWGAAEAGRKATVVCGSSICDGKSALASNLQASVCS